VVPPFNPLTVGAAGTILSDGKNTHPPLTKGRRRRRIKEMALPEKFSADKAKMSRSNRYLTCGLVFRGVSLSFKGGTVPWH